MSALPVPDAPQIKTGSVESMMAVTCRNTCLITLLLPTNFWGKGKSIRPVAGVWRR